MGVRRKAREQALQILYEMEVSRINANEALKLYWENLSDKPADKEFTEFIVRGVERYKDEIDRLIQSVSENWQINRMVKVDLNILRMAIFELLHCNDIPSKVSINEAIDLGKKFGTDDSPAFINGILDRVLKDYVIKKGDPIDGISG